MKQQYLIPFILLIILILILLYIFYFKKYNLNIESFSNNDKLNDGYLYPVRGLQNICAKDNLKPSFMPKACYVDGVLNSYANCKCEDKEGNCKICYDTIKKDNKNSNIVYNANDFS